MQCARRRVVTVHDLTLIDHPGMARAVQGRSVLAGDPTRARDARAIICVSEHTKKRLLANAVQPVGEVFTIPHGIDHTWFRPEGDAAFDQSVLERLGISQAPYVFQLGTIEPRKNQVGLVAAFSELWRRTPSPLASCSPAAGDGDRTAALGDT